MKRNAASQRTQILFVIIFTSLTWIFLDVIFLLVHVDTFTKCFTTNPMPNQSSDYRVFIRKYPEPSPVFDFGVKMHGISKKGTKRRRLMVKVSPKPNTFTHAKGKSKFIEGDGEMGRPVLLSKKYEEARQERFKENEFDVYVSELIALNRSIRDTRNPLCARKEYEWDLPATSIIIVYHNEAWTTLLRNVHSIINRTPEELLVEIILVDDFSDRDYLKRPLDDYLRTLEDRVKIVVLRMPERSGLIKARVAGASKAQGPVLTFLDAHCEVNIGWLEPLLAEIHKDKSHVVSPVIDIIEAHDFAYVGASDTKIGGFDWALVFHWYDCPEREMERRKGDDTLPIRTPAIAGGLFSIDKEYFDRIGAYDTGMEVWGAENIEMSIRIWMCGGTLEIIPCSHVGHIFRSVSPYTFPGGSSHVIYKNQRRLVEVWLDEWKAFYYEVSQGALNYEAGNFTDRIELKKNLRCKSFKWFLKNIFPEAYIPQDLSTVIQIKDGNTNLCLDTMGRSKNHLSALTKCHRGFYQTFAYENNTTIANNGLCLTLNTLNYQIILKSCQANSPYQAWTYIETDQTMRSNRDMALCWTGMLNEEKNQHFIRLLPCDSESKQQKWILNHLIK